MTVRIRNKMGIISLLCILVFSQYPVQGMREHQVWSNTAYANEVPTDKTNNTSVNKKAWINELIDKFRDEVVHYLKEIMYISGTAIFFLVIYILKEKIAWIPKKTLFFMKKIKTKYEFNKIFKTENSKKLEEQYVTNSLRVGRSNNEVEKRLAILQLTQYSGDKTLDGLIDLLKDEKERDFQCLIITALHKIVQKRQE